MASLCMCSAVSHYPPTHCPRTLQRHSNHPIPLPQINIPKTTIFHQVSNNLTQKPSDPSLPTGLSSNFSLSTQRKLTALPDSPYFSHSQIPHMCMHTYHPWAWTCSDNGTALPVPAHFAAGPTEHGSIWAFLAEQHMGIALPIWPPRAVSLENGLQKSTRPLPALIYSEISTEMKSKRLKTFVTI